MDGLLLSAGRRMNHIHHAAIVTAVAQLWVTAQRNANLASDGGLRCKLEYLYKHSSKTCSQCWQT